MIKAKSAIRKLLTDKEIGECLGRAFRKLSPEERESLQPVIDELTEIPRLGPKSALNLIFSVDQAPALTKLNETLNQGLKGG